MKSNIPSKFKPIIRIKDAINNYSDYIMRETLAIDINFDEKATEEFTINEDIIKIAIEKK